MNKCDECFSGLMASQYQACHVHVVDALCEYFGQLNQKLCADP